MVAGFSPAPKAARMALAFPAVTPGLSGWGAADVPTRRSRSARGSLARPKGGVGGARLHLPRLLNSNSASANRRREQTRSSGRSTGRLGKGAGSIFRLGSVKRSGSVLAPGRDISPGYADEDRPVTRLVLGRAAFRVVAHSQVSSRTYTTGTPHSVAIWSAARRASPGVPVNALRAVRWQTLPADGGTRPV